MNWLQSGENYSLGKAVTYNSCLGYQMKKSEVAWIKWLPGIKKTQNFTEEMVCAEANYKRCPKGEWITYV
jgi:hypothetical protein